MKSIINKTIKHLQVTKNGSDRSLRRKDGSYIVNVVRRYFNKLKKNNQEREKKQQKTKFSEGRFCLFNWKEKHVKFSVLECDESAY